MIPRFAFLKKRLNDLAGRGENTLSGCLGLSGLEALDTKISTMKGMVPLAATFLDPFTKTQFEHIEKVVPGWNLDKVWNKVHGKYLNINIKAKDAVREIAKGYTNVQASQSGHRKSEFDEPAPEGLDHELHSYGALPTINSDVLEFWKSNSDVSLSPKFPNQ